MTEKEIKDNLIKIESILLKIKNNKEAQIKLKGEMDTLESELLDMRFTFNEFGYDLVLI